MAEASGSKNVGSVYADFDIDLTNLQKGLADASKAIKQYQKSVNEATGNSGLDKGADKLKNSLDKTKGAAQQTAKEFQGLSAVGGGLTKILGVIGTALASIAAIKWTAEGVVAAGNMEKQFTVLGLVAKRLGYDVDNTMKLFEDMSNTLQFASQGAVAQSIDDFMHMGVSISDISKLMPLLNDAILAGADSNITYDEALNNITQGLKGNMSELLDRAGIQENITEITNKGAAALQAEGKAYDEQSAKIRGLYEVLKDTQGAGNLLQGTFSSNLRVVQSELTKTKQSLGAAFMPIFNEVLKALIPLIHGIRKFIESIDFTVIANGIKVAINYIVAFSQIVGSALKSILSIIPGFNNLGSSLGVFKKNTNSSGKAVDDLKNKLSGVDAGKFGQLSQEAQKAQKAIQKLNQELADEAYNYNKQLASIIDGHRESLKANQQTWEEETAEFKTSQEERKAEFDKTLSEMDKDHKKKIADLMKDRDKELKQYKDNEAEKLKNFEDSVKQIKKDNASKLYDLKRKLAQELGFTGKHNRENIKLIQEQIAYEEQQQAEQLQEQKDKLDEELAVMKANSDEKIKQIDDEIAETNAKYEQDLAEKKARYEKDTENERKEYEKRSKALQEKIAEDTAFLLKHADDERSINRGMLLDEVDDLKRSHAQRVQAIQDSMAEQVKITQAASDQMKDLLGGIEMPEMKGFDFNFDMKGVDEAKKKIFGFFDDIKKKITDSPLWKSIQSTFEPFSKVFSEAIGRLKNTWQPLVDAFNNAKPLFDAIGVVLGVVIVAAIVLLEGAINGLINVVTGIITTFTGVINVIAGLWDILVGIFTLNGDKIKEGLDKTFKGLGQIVSGLFDTITGFARGISDTILKFFGFDTFSQAMEKTKNMIQQWINSIGSWISNAWNNIKNTVTNTVNGIWSTVSGAFSNIYNSVSGSLNSFWNLIVGVWNKIRNFMGDKVNDIRNIGGGAFDGIIGGMKSGLKWIIDKLNSFKNGLNRIINSLNNWSPVYIPQIPDIYVPGLATGGTVSKGGLTAINEKGFELVDLPKGAKVYRHNDSMSLMSGIKDLIHTFRVNAATMMGSNVTSNVKSYDTDSSFGGKKEINIYNDNKIDSSIDIRRLNQEMEYEARTTNYSGV